MNNKYHYLIQSTNRYIPSYPSGPPASQFHLRTHPHSLPQMNQNITTLPDKYSGRLLDLVVLIDLYVVV
jgi:hypothetical protein